MDGGGPADRHRPVRLPGDFLRLPDHGLYPERLHRAVRRQQLQHRATAGVPHLRRVGRARRVATAVGADPGRLDQRGRPVQPLLTAILQPAADL